MTKTLAEQMREARRRFYAAVADFADPPFYDESLEQWFIPANAIPYHEAVRSVAWRLADLEFRRLNALRGFAAERTSLGKEMKALLVDPSAMHHAVTRFIGQGPAVSLVGISASYLALLEDDGFTL